MCDTGVLDPEVIEEVAEVIQNIDVNLLILGFLILLFFVIFLRGE